MTSIEGESMQYLTMRRKRRQQPLDARAAGRSALPTLISLLRWIPVLILTGVVLLTSLPARAHDFFLETGDGWIKGRARQARLGDVLDNLAERNGYTVYLDQKLVAVPVTFDIPAALDAEKAIRRIVHPHSYALVFARVPGKGGIRIEQVKVYSEGTQASSYVLLSGSGGAPVTVSSYARGGASTARTLRSSVQTGEAAVARLVKPPLQITKSSLGFTGYRLRNRNRGPDYRPGVQDMAKAYANYRQERQAFQDRSDSAVLLEAHRKAEQSKSKSRSQRMESIQQTINGPQE